MLENQFVVGDYVTINAITGHIEEIGMRIVKIRDDAGKLFILSNGDISLVCNLSRGQIREVMDIGLAPGTDIVKATRIIDAAGVELAKEQPDLTLTAPPVALGVGTDDATHTLLRVSICVGDPARLIPAQTALRTLVHARLTEKGIAAG